jgi:hypothetical protein
MTKLLKVTTVDFYEIGTVMGGNGWTEEQVIQDWFESGRINGSHASRDASRIGGARVFIDAQTVSDDEFEAHFAEES